MSITIGTPTTATSATVTHNCAVGTRVLVFGFYSSSGTAGGGTATWNGVAMTKALGAAACIAIFYKLSPDTGSHDAVATGPSGTTAAFVLDLSGDVALGAPINSGTHAAGGYQQDIATLVGSVVIDVGMTDMGSGSPTIGTGQTQIFKVDQGSTIFALSSYETATGTPTSITWGGDVTTSAAVAVEFRIQLMSTLTENSTATDSLNRQVDRIVSEIVTATDFLAQAGRNLSKTLTDTIISTDSMTRLVNASATLWGNLTKSGTSWNNEEKS